MWNLHGTDTHRFDLQSVLFVAGLLYPETRRSGVGKSMHELGQRIEEEFAEYFSGNNSSIPSEMIQYRCAQQHVYIIPLEASQLYCVCSVIIYTHAHTHIQTHTQRHSLTHSHAHTMSYIAIVEGDSLADIYTKVKDVVHEQSENYTRVPFDESLEYVTTIP